MNFSFQEPGDFFPCKLTNCLDRLTLLAKDDPLVPISRNINHLIDPDGTVVSLFPILRFHRQLVW